MYERIIILLRLGISPNLKNWKQPSLVLEAALAGSADLVYNLALHGASVEEAYRNKNRIRKAR